MRRFKSVSRVVGKANRGIRALDASKALESARVTRIGMLPTFFEARRSSRKVYAKPNVISLILLTRLDHSNLLWTGEAPQTCAMFTYLQHTLFPLEHCFCWSSNTEPSDPHPKCSSELIRWCSSELSRRSSHPSEVDTVRTRK